MDKLVRVIVTFTLINSSLGATTLTEKIIGGTEAFQGEFPFIVSIQIAASGSHYCGGGLISNSVVITAAHCVTHDLRPSTYTVYVGSPVLGGGGVHYLVSSIVYHEDYNSTTLHNDIALVVLSTPVELTSDVTLVTLPSSSFDIPPDAVVTALGWGSTEYPNISYAVTLNYVYLGVTTNDECSSTLGTEILESQLCVGGELSRGTCFADSGTPLIYGEDTAIGLVSWGLPCGVGFPDVFTRVSAFRDWIQKHTST